MSHIFIDFRSGAAGCVAAAARSLKPTTRLTCLSDMFMSKQPPVLKVDLLSSAIAGAGSARCASTARASTFTRHWHAGGVIGGFIARNRVLAMFAAGGFSHRHPPPFSSNLLSCLTASAGFPIGMWVGQM